MKLIIDISDSTYEAIMARDWKNAGWLFGEELKAIHDGTPIPDNATNGDILKRLLYGKAIITEFIYDVNIRVNNKVIGYFVREWWNAPYKRGDTE